MRSGLAVISSALLVICGGGTSAQTVTRDPQGRSVTADMRAFPVHVGGRVVRVKLPGLPKGATGFRHEWPGIYWEAAFEGDAVVLKFDDRANEYRLWVDARPRITLAQPGRAEVKVPTSARARTG